MAWTSNATGRGLRVLLVLGHPRTDSFGAALAAAYRDGARQAGAQVRSVTVAEADFDPDVHVPSPADQSLEPALEAAQAAMAWAEHLVFVYPTWWGTYPARMKGFLDRVLTPGFAFNHRDDGFWDRLLAGRTAELITTMDTPLPVYRWLYGAPGHRAMSRATLGYCGVKTLRKTVFGPIMNSSDPQRADWIETARNLGRRLEGGPMDGRQRIAATLGAWLRALRLQFYPMTWVAYAIGALAAVQDTAMDWGLFWIGYLALFLLEVATVFSNERFDYPSDVTNRNAGPFNGGSRVLVDGSIRPEQLMIGFWLALLGFVASVGWLAAAAAWPVGWTLLGAAVLATLALGYTVPPLKFSHRGLGEIDVAVTHSIAVMLAGWLVQQGAPGDPLPWLLALPLGLAVLPAILLSGVPDHDADRDGGKRTLVVILGIPAAVTLAMLSVAAAAGLALVWYVTGLVHPAYNAVILITLPHAIWLVRALNPLRAHTSAPGRIDGLMVLALSFIVWFGLVPLLALWV